MEEDSVRVVGKGCNCQKRWQNTDLVDFSDDNDGISHPSPPFLGPGPASFPRQCPWSRMAVKAGMEIEGRAIWAFVQALPLTRYVTQDY